MTKPTHETRDRSGRYSPGHLCDCCNKPAGTDPLCDDEVTRGDQIPGFILCERKRCEAKRDALDVEGRRALYAAAVAARES